MIGWHHQLDGHEFESTLRVGDGHGSLACCSPWGHKGSNKITILIRGGLILIRSVVILVGVMFWLGM